MNYIKNRFSGKKNVFKVVFASSMVIATVGIYCFYCSDYQTVNNPEKQIGHESNIVQSVSKSIAEIDNGIYLYSARTPIIVLTKTIPKAKKAVVYEERVAPTPVVEKEVVVEEPVVTEPVRQNKLYSVYESKEDYTYNLDTQYQDYLYEMCVKYDVVEHYELFLAQMFHESRFDTDVISQTSDYGLMQINTCNHKWLGKALDNNDFLDPYNNIEAGVYMMSDSLKKYGDVHKALVCYNRGESAVRNGTYSTSYSKCVIADMNKLVELN